MRRGLVMAALLAACGSPAIDSPKPAPVIPDPVRPQPQEEVAVDGDFDVDFAGFAARVASAQRADPGPVALFQACTDDPQHPPGTQVFATGAGDWAAARTILALWAIDKDFELWAPAATAQELQRSNRSLADVRRPEDAVALAAQAEAGYAVFGTIAIDWVGGRLEGRKRVRLAYRCVRAADGTSVAELAGTIEKAPEVRYLSTRAESLSATPLGARAAHFTPSLDREVELLADRGARPLVSQRRATFAGKRVGVTAGTGRLLAAARTRVVNALPRLLPGKDAIAVVDRGGEVMVHLDLVRGTRQWTLSLRVEGTGVASGSALTLPFDDRFTAALAQAMGEHR